MMSTYNGEKYLEEQIESIASQTGVTVKLLVRDDGSTDRTLEILHNYQKKYSWIDLIEEENIGAPGSFRQLVLDVPKCKYYAFSDQDDIWHPQKLETAIKRINQSSNSRTLYVGNQNCVDAEGRFLNRRLPDHFLQENVISTIIQNDYSGCTMVFDDCLLEEVKKIYREMGHHSSLMHDICFLSVAQLIGNVIYDPDAYIDFRRHGDNFSEAEQYMNMSIRKKAELFKHKWRTFKNRKSTRGNICIYCKALLNVYANRMSKNDYDNIQYLTEYKNNLLNWIASIFKNRLKQYYREPKWNVMLKFFFRMY